jgi:hypothetical protein
MPLGKGDRMISRIRIDAYGRTASDVEAQLLDFATACDEKVGASSCAYGEMVIERQLEEPYGSDFAFKGRQLLHPSIGESPFVPAKFVIDERSTLSPTQTNG